MNIIADSKLDKPMAILDRLVRNNPGLDDALSNTTVMAGPASNPKFRIPLGAVREAVHVDGRFVADSKHTIATEEVREMFKRNPRSVDTKFLYDKEHDNYRLHAQKRRYIADGSAEDAAPDFLGAQALSPWNVGWFQSIFKAPLLYSHALDIVKVESGTEPWCEVMNLHLADYMGLATLEDTGAVSANNVANVQVTSGLMTSPVINISSSYDLSIEELKRAEQSGSPFGQQLITIKQKYADYVLHLLTSYLIYYGNTASETVGLLQVPSSITSYSGSSMLGIFNGSSTTKGSDQLTALQSIIVPFLNSLYNKVKTLVIVMSPACYNYLTVPYSAIYNPTAGLKAMLENFIAGKMEKGGVPNIEIVIEPLLAANTVFNTNAYDYTLLLAPEIPTGPDEESQPMLLFGAPLMEFVYPTIPGSFDTQYKFLRRIAGIFAPVKAAVAAYSGFGQKTATT